MGGVTAVFEMPNTKPSTSTAAALQDKLQRAAGRAWCDYAFFVGATADNVAALAELERLPGCCGGKIFMGSSTGSLLVADADTPGPAMETGSRRSAAPAADGALLHTRLRTETRRGHS